jgi:hypothetical protein
MDLKIKASKARAPLLLANQETANARAMKLPRRLTTCARSRVVRKTRIFPIWLQAETQLRQFQAPRGVQA